MKKQIIKHLFLSAVAALALCSAAQATTYDCMGSGLAGQTAQGVGRQFGVRAGDWENAQLYVGREPATGRVIGWSWYWYCTKTIQVPVHPPVAVGGATTTPTVQQFTTQRIAYVQNWGGTNAFWMGLQDKNLMAQMRAQGPAWLALVVSKQCHELEALRSYPTADDKTLCEGLLAKARAYAPSPSP
jgi:hypothetical protein